MDAEKVIDNRLVRSLPPSISFGNEFPITKYAFGSEESVNEGNEVLCHYRKLRLAQQGVEAAKNPYDVPYDERETTAVFMIPVRKERMKEERSITEDSEQLRIRRKIVSGSYKNSSVKEDKLPSLLRYVWKGKLKKVNNYLKNQKNHLNINKNDKQKRTALHMAASWADENMLKLLLEVPGINVNAMDVEGKTSLRKAVEMNSLSCVKLLIAHKADPRIVARDCRNPFEYALQELGDSAFEIISFLCDDGLMFREKNELARFTHLHQLCIARDHLSVHKVAKELLQLGAFVNATDGDGQTPLILAAKKGRSELVRTLLDFDADILHANMSLRSAIDYASVNGECYRILKRAATKLIKEGKCVFGIENCRIRGISQGRDD